MFRPAFDSNDLLYEPGDKPRVWERSREPPVATVCGHATRREEHRGICEVRAKAAPLQAAFQLLN
jgi:hypothetical protein